MCCGWGGWMGWGGFGMFGWFFGLILTLGVLVLFVVGIIWLARQVTGTRGTLSAPTHAGGDAAAGRTCPTCGRPVAAEWNVCPYDGTPLSS